MNKIKRYKQFKEARRRLIKDPEQIINVDMLVKEDGVWIYKFNGTLLKNKDKKALARDLAVLKGYKIDE